MLADTAVGSLETHLRDIGQVVTATQNAHASEICITPANQAHFPTGSEVGPVYLDTLAMLVQFRQQALCSKHQQVRVLGDDSLHNATLLEVDHLRIGLVGRDHILYIHLLQFFNQLAGHVGRHIDGLLELLVCLGSAAFALQFQSQDFAFLTTPMSVGFSACLAGEIVAIEHEVRRYAEVKEHTDSVKDIVDVPIADISIH